MIQFVYPRLPYTSAERRVQQIADAFQHGGLVEVESLVAFDHPRAEPVPTGGRVADTAHIERVREAALTAIAPWREQGSVSRPQVASFDLALGRALHDNLAIVPADAAHDGTWNFLTLVVMPDVAVLRFPELHPDRLFGTDRNALRRPWFRRDTLGDLTDRYPRPLGEDEMVGLFERSSMARNRALVRALATAVMEFEGAGARSEWAREMYKEVRYATGPRAFDGMDEVEIASIVRQYV